MGMAAEYIECVMRESGVGCGDGVLRHRFADPKLLLPAIRMHPRITRRQTHTIAAARRGCACAFFVSIYRSLFTCCDRINF